ncbi:10140_t:CDS:2 [Funneliformis caledonium]|uniref:10140_t:CDS:1 n=1 Tax=Funneliformis caledonium TaxID=1117310 RepID=A0A9N9HJJ5_9GLOM|nr:10140_t:CDS:2 [Funneliformis caledonium]
MSCSFALEVCLRMAEVEMLIASHMATAIGVSDDRTDLLCTSPSDPILASGILKGIIKVGLEDCLDTLLKQFSHRVVEAGERGELVLLLLFLKALCKGIDEKIDDLFEKMHIDKAEIENLIREAYHRHTAFKMPLGFSIIDYVIPFKYFTNKSAFDNNNFEGIILGIYIDNDTSNYSIDMKEVDSIVLRGKNPVTNRAIYIENI